MVINDGGTGKCGFCHTVFFFCSFNFIVLSFLLQFFGIFLLTNTVHCASIQVDSDTQTDSSIRFIPVRLAIDDSDTQPDN